jgi:hypothetical protein
MSSSSLLRKSHIAVVVVIIVVLSSSTSFDICRLRPQNLISQKCWEFRVAGTVARRTHQFVTLKHTFGIVLQEPIHEFSALLTFIGSQSFSFSFLANNFLVAKGGRIIHRGYCICCCCCWLGSSSSTTTMVYDGPLFCFWRLGGVSPRRSSRHCCGGRFGGGGASTRLSDKVLHRTIGDPALLFRTSSSSTGTGIRLFGVSFVVGRSGTIRCAAAARGLCAWTSSSRYLGKLLQRLQRRVFVRLRTCWLSYRCRIVSYRCLVLVAWLWFGCSKVVVVVVGGCCCWQLLLLLVVVVVLLAVVVVGGCCCWLL